MSSNPVDPTANEETLKNICYQGRPSELSKRTREKEEERKKEGERERVEHSLEGRRNSLSRREKKFSLSFSLTKKK